MRECPYLTCDGYIVNIREYDICTICNYKNCAHCKVDHNEFTCLDFARINQRSNPENYIKLLFKCGINAWPCQQCGYIVENPKKTLIINCLECQTRFCSVCKDPLEKDETLDDHIEYSAECVRFDECNKCDECNHYDEEYELCEEYVIIDDYSDDSSEHISEYSSESYHRHKS